MLIRSAIHRLWATEALALAALLLAGWALTLAEGGRCHADSFFGYRIRYLDDVPAWFVAAIILILLNGWQFCRKTTLRAGTEAPGDFREAASSRNANALGVNLVAIPGLLLVFLVVRAMGW